MRSVVPVVVVLLLASVGGIGCSKSSSGKTAGDPGATVSGGGVAGPTGVSVTGGARGTTPGASDVPSCADPLFVDAIAPAAWFNIDVAAAAGAQGIRDAIRSAQADHPNQPVRVRLAPGAYAENLGGEIYAQRVLRTAKAPLWIVATDPAPNHTSLTQGFNFVGVAYIAIEGITVGPATVGAWNGKSHANPQPSETQAAVHIAGAARDAKKSAKKLGGGLDASVYGQYEPSHHIVVRHMTVQNLFGKDDPSGEQPVGQDHDGMKFNQVEDLWVLDNTVTQTSRHGIDNVGVHHAAYCRNVVTRTGAGLGLEAKGGSYQILYERNTFYHVRRVELGGEATDATYYWSADGRYDYEARRVVARDNLIIDARETAIDISGCTECALIDNTISYTAGYKTPLTDDGNANGGDAIRAHHSALLSAADGAGNDCVTWDAAQNDYVTVDPCWGVGSKAPAPVGKALVVSHVTMTNNLFTSASGIWSTSFGTSNASPSTIPCPLNLIGEVPAGALSMDYDAWWNGGKPLPAEGCSALPEGAHGKKASADPALVGGAIDGGSPGSVVSTAAAALAPKATSPLRGAGKAGPADAAGYDFLGRARPAKWGIGAIDVP